MPQCLPSLIQPSSDWLEHHPIPTLLIEPSTGNLLFYNKAAKATFGFNGSKKLSISTLFTSPEEGLFFLDSLQNKEAMAVATYQMLTGEGAEIWVELHLTPLSLEGQSVYQAAAINCTHRVEEEKKARKLSQRYSAFIEGSVAGIFCQELRVPLSLPCTAEELIAHLGEHGYVSECNSMMAVLYGYPDKDQLLMHRGNLLMKLDRDPVGLFSEFISNGYKLLNRESAELVNGGQRYFITNLQGIIEEGRLLRVWGTQRDFSKLRGLQAKRDLLAHLVDQSADVLTAADMNYRPVTWNKTAEAMYGITTEEAVGSDLRNYIDIRYPGSSREDVRKAIAEGGEWRGEMSFVRPTDKKRVTLLTSYKLLREDFDGPQRVIVSSTDITAIKEAEARYIESEKRFRELANNAPVMIWMIDENDVVSYLNPTWLSFTGEDITGDTGSAWSRLVHPDDLPAAQKAYEASYKAKGQATLVYRLKSKDGIYRWVKDVSVPRFLSDGTFVGYIGSVVDIEEQKKTEHQLRYQGTILENVSDLVITSDLHFNVVSWNKVAEVYTGITECRARGKSISQLLRFTISNTSPEAVLDYLDQMGKWEGEIVISDKEGDPLYFHFIIQYMHDDAGRRIGVLGIGRDITERKKIEARLLKSEQFHRSLIADSLDSILLLNEEGVIHFCSPALKRVLGYEPETVIGRSAFEFVHPEDLFTAADAFRKEVVENPDIKFIVIRLRKQSGEWIHCMVRGHNLLKNPYVNSMVLYIHDDTPRQKVIGALKESERRFRELIRDLQLGVILQDADARLLHANEAACRLLGLTEHQLEGSTAFDPSWNVIRENGEPLPASEHPVPLAIQTHKPVRDVVMGVFRPLANDRVWLLVNAEPILSEDNELVHVICSFTDITERKKLEQKILTDGLNHQKQLTQATFDGQEAERREIGKELHDNIGQQLTSIKLFLELAKGTVKDDASLEMLNLGLKGVMDVINEIRAMSRALVPYTLKDLGLIESVTDLIDGLSRTQLLKIELQSEDFDEEVLPDNQKLTLFRIVQEQFNNIARHAQATKVEISIQSREDATILQILDNGKGFNPALSRKGLGLTNIANRVGLFGGKAEIQSSPGKGTRLKVVLPAAREEKK